jgi:HD superfamily phosphohydrolase
MSSNAYHGTNHSAGNGKGQRSLFGSQGSQGSQKLKKNKERYIIDSRSDLLRAAKWIRVPVVGTVNLTLMAKFFIDNPFFQRLGYLKQLGVCHMVYPGGTHTRKEHSFGTYALADRLLARIRSASDNIKMTEWLGAIPELMSHYAKKDNEFGPGLNLWICELVKIAALCHDIGHGPYSHLFDDVFIKNSSLSDHPLATHENRSCAIVERIVRDSEILSRFITSDDIEFIKSVINPPPHANGFIHQIVSGDLDVDRLDYISRDAHHTDSRPVIDSSHLIENVLVIDNKLVYAEQAKQYIFDLFSTRHALHRSVYCHKSVMSAQYIVIGIMKILDKVINITNSILDLEEFSKMTDEYLMNLASVILEWKTLPQNPYAGRLTENDYAELAELMNRMQNHNLYPHIGTVTSRGRINIDREFSSDIYIIFKGKIGFVSGNKPNPLDGVYVYRTKDHFRNGHNVKVKRIDRTDISHLTPDIHQEYITMIFRCDNDDVALEKDKQLFRKHVKAYGAKRTGPVQSIVPNSHFATTSSFV